MNMSVSPMARRDVDPGSGGDRNTYTVQRGDTLWEIARDHGVSLQALIQANPQIANPDLIYPDQAITLPEGAAQPPGAGTSGGDDGATPVAAGNDGQAPAPAGDTGSPGAAPKPGEAVKYSPYNVYSTGESPAISLRDPSQMQPHHDYQSSTRNGQKLEVRDLVLDHAGQPQNQQAIPSPIEGQIIHAGPMGNAGNAVGIRDANGKETWIFHMSSIDVKVGQKVGYGQDLGNQGTTGHSTGEHVHIESSSAVINRWVNDLLDGTFDGRRT